MGITQAHAQRTEESRDVRHEVRDGHDDEVAASHADDGDMKSMSEFARVLRDKAVKPEDLDVEFVRVAVAELRHNLDAMEAIHQKQMETMSADMKSKVQRIPTLLTLAFGLLLGWMIFAKK